jgi:hypothetical protein
MFVVVDALEQGAQVLSGELPAEDFGHWSGGSVGFAQAGGVLTEQMGRDAGTWSAGSPAR